MLKRTEVFACGNGLDVSGAVHLPACNLAIFQCEQGNFFIDYDNPHGSSITPIKYLGFDIDDGFIFDEDDTPEKRVVDELQKVFFEPWKVRRYIGSMIPSHLAGFTKQEIKTSKDGFSSLRENGKKPLLDPVVHGCQYYPVM